MNKKSIIDLLSKEFPGKNISELPLEIICEVEPTKDHPDWSEAVAYINKSDPHYHKETTEKYIVEKGELRIIVDEKEHILKERDRITIDPPSVHWAYGEWVRVRVYSEPGWTPKDHLLTNKIIYYINEEVPKYIIDYPESTEQITPTSNKLMRDKFWKGRLKSRDQTEKKLDTMRIEAVSNLIARIHIIKCDAVKIEREELIKVGNFKMEYKISATVYQQTPIGVIQ